MMTSEQVQARLEELAMGDSNDEEIEGLQDLVWDAFQPVCAPTDGWRWCIRHGGPIRDDAFRCMAWFYEAINGREHDDPGKCVKVPMYIDAEDP